jgi:hypothetical protein
VRALHVSVRTRNYGYTTIRRRRRKSVTVNRQALEMQPAAPSTPLGHQDRLRVAAAPLAASPPWTPRPHHHDLHLVRRSFASYSHCSFPAANNRILCGQLLWRLLGWTPPAVFLKLCSIPNLAFELHTTNSPNASERRRLRWVQTAVLPVPLLPSTPEIFSLPAQTQWETTKAMRAGPEEQ